MRGARSTFLRDKAIEGAAGPCGNLVKPQGSGRRLLGVLWNWDVLEPAIMEQWSKAAEPKIHSYSKEENASRPYDT
jgi:hypothetical protein